MSYSDFMLCVKYAVWPTSLLLYIWCTTNCEMLCTAAPISCSPALFLGIIFCKFSKFSIYMGITPAVVFESDLKLPTAH